MYKVFFKDRTVFFEEDFIHSLKNANGLFYPCDIHTNMEKIAHLFFELTGVANLLLIHHDARKAWKTFQSCFKPVTAAGGLVRNSKGELLVIFRNGMWDLPKGKQEKGESNEDTALREVAEECGLKQLSIIRPLTKTYHTYLINGTQVLKTTHWFEMITSDTEDPVPQELENITNAQWADPQNLDYFLKNTYLSILDVLKDGGIVHLPNPVSSENPPHHA